MGQQLPIHITQCHCDRSQSERSENWRSGAIFAQQKTIETRALSPSTCRPNSRLWRQAKSPKTARRVKISKGGSKALTKQQPNTSPNVIATSANLSTAKIGEAEQSLPNRKQ